MVRVPHHDPEHGRRVRAGLRVSLPSIFLGVVSPSNHSRTLSLSNRRPINVGSGLVAGAMAGVEMRLKIAVEELHGAFNGRSGHVDKGTKSLPFIECKDLAQLPQKGFLTLTLLDLL